MVDCEDEVRTRLADDPWMEAILTVEHVSKTYRSGGFLGRGQRVTPAVQDVTLSLPKGATLGIVGESGSGKTTLGLAILRLISSDGPIVFLGKPLQGLKFKAMRPFRHDMQIVFQDPFGSLSPRMSISDIIEEGLWVHQPQLTAAQREAALSQRHQGPHADGMAAQKIFLKGQNLIRLDALIREFPEAGVDAVDNVSLGEKLVQAAARAFDALAGDGGQPKLFDSAGENAFGVVEGEAVAGEVECCGHAPQLASFAGSRLGTEDPVTSA